MELLVDLIKSIILFLVYCINLVKVSNNSCKRTSRKREHKYTNELQESAYDSLINSNDYDVTVSHSSQSLNCKVEWGNIQI